MNPVLDRLTETKIELPKLLFDFRSIPINTIADYKRLRHVKELYAQAFKSIPKNSHGTPLELDKWMQVLKRNNRNKFLRRLRDKWSQLTHPIPLQLLELLGITLNDLDHALALDQDEFEKALSLANKPVVFQYRIMACIYPVKTLPEGLDETEAIAYVQHFLKENRPGDTWSANIHYRDIKCIWIHQDSFFVNYYRPGIKIEQGAVVFTDDGRDVGTVRI